MQLVQVAESYCEENYMRYAQALLRDLVRTVFGHAGSSAEEAAAVADHLVEANLAGHDSHGVIRVKKYIDWARAGLVQLNRHARIVQASGAIVILEGDFGYGQVIGREAIAIGIERAAREGMAVLAIRNSGHLGRIGAWAEQAAAAGLLSLHFVNTSGFGILVAPHGGSDRRLSANPIAAGIPIANTEPLILDMSTSVIAEGKIQVARNRGQQLAEGMLLDGHGRPTRDPEVFYANPPGAILPLGGHKGSGLSFFCEVLAGTLTGGGSSHPDNPTAKRLVNNMFSLLFAPQQFVAPGAFAADLDRLIAWVKASPPAQPGGKVLLPGEPERRTRAERLANGIPLDATTLGQLAEAARQVGMPQPDFEQLKA
jgi:hydroxycarboxylate dehydrogenase B